MAAVRRRWRQVEPVPFEPGRYWVASDSDPEHPHLVDLNEYGGNGWCGCLGFLHYQPELEAGAAPDDGRRCRHIKAARLWQQQHQK